jgi:hypothetical protein
LQSLSIKFIWCEKQILYKDKIKIWKILALGDQKKENGIYLKIIISVFFGEKNSSIYVLVDGLDWFCI